MKRSSALLEANILGLYSVRFEMLFSTSLTNSKRDCSFWPICFEGVKTYRTEGWQTVPSPVCCSDLWNSLLVLHRLRWVWKVLSTAISKRISRSCVSSVRRLFTQKSGVHPALSVAFLARTDTITHRVPVYHAAITAPVRMHPTTTTWMKKLYRNVGLRLT
jgi:hypothetical protein